MNDLEGLRDGAMGAGDAEGSASLIHLPTATDEHADAGAIDKIEGGEIEDHFAASIGDEALDGRLGVAEGVAEMEAAGDLDDSGGGLDKSCIDRVGHAGCIIAKNHGGCAMTSLGLKAPLTRTIPFLLH